MTRSDGRKNDELRLLKITRQYIKYPEGSCLIEMGGTRVVCTASVEEKVPPFIKGTGGGWVTAEYGMLPRSCQVRTAREAGRNQVGGRTMEIQRLVGRSLRAITDLSAIGERTIILDCDVIQADGGTRTASVTGGFVAFADALNKMRQDGLLKRLPISDVLCAISVGVVQNEELLDLDYAEDSDAMVDMNVVMTAGGRLVEVQGTAERQPFSRARFNRLMDLAEKGVQELSAKVKELLADVL